MLHTALPKCSNRRVEWCCAIIVTQLGVLTLFSELILRRNPVLSFEALLDWQTTPLQIGLLFFAVGVLRIVALYRNGRWKRGPHVRAACAFIGGIVWGQLLYGVLMVWTREGVILNSMGVWDTFLVFEYFSFRRAIMDIRIPPSGQVAQDNG